MKIEFQQQEDAVDGPEVWVRVLSNEVVDVDQVRKSAGKRWDNAGLRAYSVPKQYYPHRPTLEEMAEHGYRFEDWWTFKRIGDPC